MTHTQRLFMTLAATRVKHSAGNQWGERHYQAWTSNRDVGQPIVKMVVALANYADNHQRRYGSRIGDDGVLGRHWEAAVHAVRGLLCGDCGGLDCGTVDGMLLDMLHAEGIQE